MMRWRRAACRRRCCNSKSPKAWSCERATGGSRCWKRSSSRGIRLAIDDFGTGYSSMSLMKQFPIDTIKIDRSFVRDLPDDTEDQAIAQAIIGMGKALGMTIVAEGVETIEQEQFLREQAATKCRAFCSASRLLRGRWKTSFGLRWAVRHPCNPSRFHRQRVPDRDLAGAFRR